MSASQLPVVVVGSGLAGLSAATQLITKYKIPVVLIEKADKIGGNSVKASSGINGVQTRTQLENYHITDDNAEVFYQDTLKSSKKLGIPKLMEKLARDSTKSIEWLQNDFQIKLDLLSQLGGHSKMRTHRSSGKLPPGFEIVSTLQKNLEKIKETTPELIDIKLNSKLSNIKINSITKQIEYVEVTNTQDTTASSSSNGVQQVHTNVLVLCTGGFGFNKEMIYEVTKSKFLSELPTSNGQQTLGEGQQLMQKLGAELIDMDQIQVHPTGFVDPTDRKSNVKFLAAEALRGLGGILVSPVDGQRFVNELDTRDHVTDAIFNANLPDNVALLVLSEKVYEVFANNINFYIFKKLIKKTTVGEFYKEHDVAGKWGSQEKFITQLIEYSNESTQDKFNREVRVNSFGDSINADTVIYVGEITPIIHFTMGGVKINEKAQVLNNKNELVAHGLYSAGEVTGGVHGANRLGGSSLLECVVFGRQAADSIASSYA
ncbi:hypothetical protein ACO0QE_003888 [Hanseniaspora vineae]